MFWTVLWIIAAVIVLIFAAVLILICQKLFVMACVRGEKLTVGDGFEKQVGEYKDFRKVGKELYDSLDKKDVWIKSSDGLKLHGELVKNGEVKKIVIAVHGFRSNPQHAFTASMPYFYDKGFSFLLIDHRAHGKSEGEYITYGVYERYDLCGWVRYAVETFGDDVEILLHGISMGASTVLMASGLELPQNVKGLIADSGYISPHDIFVRVLDHSFHAKPFPLLNIAGMMAKRKANFDFKGASTIDAMAVNTIPVLFVHGEDDDFVPIDMTEANYEACIAEKTIVRVKGALHACSYLVDKEACEKAMDDFLAKNFKNE
ncbi:MAG: alpha/beta hydrolase [Clostridia bacterium]|nr:alpha/beta hydrolase [Clostridia bacterium]